MLYFPYDSERKIQKALTLQILHALKNSENILAHAPTGIGKTASALSAALSYALEKDKVVFFVTPKHSQHKIAVDTLKLIKNKFNLNFDVVDFIGKKWMCLQSGVGALHSSEFGEYCHDLRKKDICEFYENFKDKGKRKICMSYIHLPLHVEEVCSICSSHKICPYEISSELAKNSRVIIADYFHVLNPSIRDNLLQRIKREIKDCIFIFDEAHNLPNRCRDLLTSKISTLTIDGAIKEAKKYFFDYGDELKDIGEQLLSLSQKTPIDIQEALVLKENFSFDKQLIVNLEIAADEVRKEQKRSYMGSVASFLNSWNGEDYGFARILEKGFTKMGKRFVSLNYRCLDPSILMKIDAHSIVLMSGTLSPCKMYKDLLGMENANVAEYNSPFPKEHKLSLVIPDTSTKYTMRSSEMYSKISDYLVDISSSIPGNVAVFFPSYLLRDSVNKFFLEKSTKTIFLEQPKMSKSEREELIEKFKSYKTKGAVLLGVAGGSLGEGIDLPGDFLKGVIVVGLALGKPDLETKELIKYYDDRFGCGMDYGYIYPAIIKSLQNTGRCIRSETDKGVVVYLDERYTWQRYAKYFSSEDKFIFTMKPVEKIKEFFS